MDYLELADELLKCKIAMEKHPSEGHVQQVIRGEIHVIRYLMENKDSAGAGELSDYCGVSTARMANILNSLEKKEYIIRKADRNDRRRVSVTLTDKGKKYGSERKAEARRDIAAMLQALGENDAVEYVRISKKIKEISMERVRRMNQEKKGKDEE